MRDMVTCFSEHAIKISETTCSSSSSSSSSYIPNQTHLKLTPALLNSVIYVYKTTRKPTLITVTWCKNQLGQGGLTIQFDNNNNPNDSFKLNTFSRLFRKKKGLKSIITSTTGRKIDLYWDLSSATYNSGPEPADGYYILVKIDSELQLALGDLAHEGIARRLDDIRANSCLKPVVLVSRREHYSGNTVYCTKAKFSETGQVHEIVVRCSYDYEGVKQPVLYVSIDKKIVLKIRRLQWNFRGNQSVFVDGLLVDLMWDVHDWFFEGGLGGGGGGCGVFMFKTRSGGESRLWLEEKLVNGKEEDDSCLIDGFSLILYASKNSN